MSSSPEEFTPTPATPDAAPQRAGLELAVERVAMQLLEQQRSDRRWRVFFRLAWLGLALAVAWALFADRIGPTAPSTPHTALVEVRGEIDADTEASAEALVSALSSAFEDQGAQAVVLRINSPGGSPVQSGIVNDEIRRLKALAQQEGLRRGRGGLRLRGLLHRRGGRRDLRRQGQHRGQHRRADGRLRLHRADGQARRRAPAAHRGRATRACSTPSARRARSRRPTPRP